jgi:hypothetical protein
MSPLGFPISTVGLICLSRFDRRKEKATRLNPSKVKEEG